MSLAREGILSVPGVSQGKGDGALVPVAIVLYGDSGEGVSDEA